jgi:hypothetical protein
VARIDAQRLNHIFERAGEWHERGAVSTHENFSNGAFAGALWTTKPNQQPLSAMLPCGVSHASSILTL